MDILTSSSLTVAATVLAATLSMVNLAYDASMINMLLLSDSFYEYFQLNDTYVGLNVAIVNLGNVIAGPFTGPLMDWLGRKRALMLGNVLQTVGIILQVTSKGMLLAGRCILGFALTITGVAGPTLVGEATPGRMHSILMNTTVLALPVFGTVVAAGGIGVYHSATNWGWRSAILGELAGPVLSTLFLLKATESPRWLVSKNRLGEAHRILDRIHSGSEVNRGTVVRVEYEEIVQTIEFEREHDERLRALVAKPSDRRRFVIVVLTNIFFQICGANTLPYFFTIMLSSAGVTDTQDTLYLNLGLCVWGTLSVGVGLWICERFGSKTILVTNTTVITVCFVLLAVLTGLGPEHGQGIGAVIVVFIFYFASSSSWLILEYTYPPAILRYSLRGKGSALGQSIGYAFCVMMTYLLPTALESLGWKFYAANAAWNVVIIAVVWLVFVETKGRTLEEMDRLFDGTVHFSVEEQRVSVTNAGIIEGIDPGENTSLRSIREAEKKPKEDSILRYPETPTLVV